MKTDARPDWDDEGERKPLQAALRSWSVPAAPAEIEQALRWEFRRRRRKPRLALWLPLAAGLALLAAWPLVAPHPAERRAAAAVATPPAPPVVKVEPLPAPVVVHVPVRAAASSRAARRPAPQRSVVVEPGQAELLAEFGRTAWRRTQAAPGALVPPMPAAETPAFRAEWEAIAGEWPAVQVVVSESGR